MENRERKLLTATEAALVLRVGVPTLYQWARQRKIPHVRLGDRLFFDVAEIIAAARVAADGDEPESLRNPKMVAKSGGRCVG